MKIQELSLDEKIQLVEDLWDSIAADQTAVPVSDEHQQELERRLNAYELDGERGQPAQALIRSIHK